MDPNPKSEEVEIDESAALASLAGQRDLLCELATIFDEDADAIMGELSTSLENQDARSVHRALHKLKGLTAAFYPEPTMSLLKRYEQEALSGSIEELKASGLETIKSNIESLRNILRQRSFLR